MGYVIGTTLDREFADTLDATRAALAAQGFGILTEIDLRAAMRDKLGVEVPAQVILGACRPPLALAALQAEPSVGVLLPCNVVVRSLDDGRTRVEAMDPATRVDLTGNERLADVAGEARALLDAALTDLAATSSPDDTADRPEETP